MSFRYRPIGARAAAVGNGARDIHDAASLPGSIHACGRTFRRSTGPASSHEAVRARTGAEPVLVDTVPFAPCPAGWCVGEACRTVVYVRVGEDALLAYELRGGP